MDPWVTPQEKNEGHVLTVEEVTPSSTVDLDETSKVFCGLECVTQSIILIR